MNVWRRSCPVVSLCLAVMLGFAARPATLQAGAPAASQLVGIYPITLAPGPTLFAPPLHGLPTACVTVATCTSNRVVVSGAPVWSGGQFAAHQVGPVKFPQYVAVLLRDAPGTTAGHRGEWWPVQGNDASSLMLDSRGTDLGPVLTAGAELELRRLPNLRELFGFGADCRLHKDRNGFGSRREEDVIRYVRQTYFTTEVFYHDGTLSGGDEGYIVNGEGPFDGAGITILPGQPVMFFRRENSTPLSITVRGQVQEQHLAHYLAPGANAVASMFPVPGPVRSAGLTEAGWGTDHDGNGSNDDHFRRVVGTSFTDEVYHHDGTHTDGAPHWIKDGAVNDDYRLLPVGGYMFFVRQAQVLRWHEAPPLAP